MGPEMNIANDLGRWVARCVGENPEPNPESGRSLGAHPRKLTSADHADDGCAH